MRPVLVEGTFFTDQLENVLQFLIQRSGQMELYQIFQADSLLSNKKHKALTQIVLFFPFTSPNPVVQNALQKTLCWLLNAHYTGKFSFTLPSQKVKLMVLNLSRKEWDKKLLFYMYTERFGKSPSAEAFLHESSVQQCWTLLQSP